MNSRTKVDTEYRVVKSPFFCPQTVQQKPHGVTELLFWATLVRPPHNFEKLPLPPPLSINYSSITWQLYAVLEVLVLEWDKPIKNQCVAWMQDNHCIKFMQPQGCIGTLRKWRDVEHTVRRKDAERNWKSTKSL